MHILLVKVQQKIMDERVEELIDRLTTGLEIAHLQITAGKTSAIPIQELVRAFELMLEIITLQKDFASYFKKLPHEAGLLLNGHDIPVDEQYAIYEHLKETMLNEDNFYNDTDQYLSVFNKHLSLKRPFFESYITLWQQLCVNELDPSPRILERLAYGTLNLLELMVDERLLHKAIYPLTEDDEKLLLRYNQNRVLHIDEVLMEGNFDADITTIDPNSRRIPCIKCGCYTALHGYTEMVAERKQFIATGFQCTQCGMELFDQKDLLLAGVKPIYYIQ